jgi:hypothetical protein
MTLTVLNASRNNDEKEKGPAATAIAPGPVSHNPIKGNENMSTVNTAAVDPASEQPWQAVQRVAHELCGALREDETRAHQMVLIYADPTITYPIAFVHVREYAKLSRLAHDYRDACRLVAECKKPKHLPRLIQGCEEVHAALLASFEVQS